DVEVGGLRSGRPRHLRAVRALIAADVDGLLDGGVDEARAVGEVDGVDAVDGGSLGREALDRLDLRLRKDEPRVECRAAGALEADRCGFVPDRVGGAQDPDEHDHVEGVERAVEASSVDRADVVARAPVERQLHADLAKVRRDVGHADAGAAVAGKEVEAPAQAPRLERLAHGRMLSSTAVYEPGYVGLMRSGELEERVEKLYGLLASCTVCPRDCGNDRTRDVLASCASGLDPVVSAATPHFGEEPVLSGTRGAGNIFLGNCNLRCVYCQNYQISQDYAAQKGNAVPVERLAEMCLELQERGCHNIGFVSPTHYAPQVARAVLLAARQGLRLPIVYNTNAYDAVPVLRLLDGIVDVYLPDFKYADNAAGWLYSKVPDYADRSREALVEMYRQKGSALVM